MYGVLPHKRAVAAPDPSVDDPLPGTFKKTQAFSLPNSNNRAMAAAAIALGAALADDERVQVRQARMRERASAWMYEIVVQPRADVQMTIEDIRAARRLLERSLQVQLSFFVKVKLQMELVQPAVERAEVPLEWPADEPRVETYFLNMAPFLVPPEANIARRMNGIISDARASFERHLESARFNNSRENIGKMLSITLLVGPGLPMAQLPPAPFVDRPVGTHAALPEGLYEQKCGIWNPQNGDHQCFAWCIRAHMAGVENWTAEERNHSTRLRHPLYFKEGFAPLRRSGRPLRNELLVPHDFGLNLTGLPQDRGVTLQDIQDFEEVNPGVHIYVYRFNKIEFGGTCYCERQLWRTPPREAEETPTHVTTP